MEPPATIFCSRELEKGLLEYVLAEVALLGPAGFPSDVAIKSKAREIIQRPTTAADDDVLLLKFKAAARERLGLPDAGSSPANVSTAPSDAMQISAMPLDIDLGITDSEITDILQDMDFDFGQTEDGGAPLDGFGDTTLDGL